jgi:hypothetical protein
MNTRTKVKGNGRFYYDQMAALGTFCLCMSFGLSSHYQKFGCRSG